jgi:Tol biopolymer transport system component
MGKPRVARSLAGAASALLLAVPPSAAQDRITRVSVDSNGGEANSSSAYVGVAVSLDGRFVAFDSFASNLVPADTNDIGDVFVHDRATGVTVRVSVDSSGVEGDWLSFHPAMSKDGRFVAFESEASNLVPGDANDDRDVFVHDRDPDENGVFDEGNGVTARVSVDSNGVEGNGDSRNPSLSGDGNLVAFDSDADNLVGGDANGDSDVFVHNRSTGKTTRVSKASDGSAGNNSSYDPSISQDGAFVAFASSASDLVPNDTNGVSDIFVRDRLNHLTSRVSIDSAGVEGNSWSYSCAISADGQIVAFVSYSDNLVAGDSNGDVDVFVHARATGVTTRVSLDSSGVEAEYGSHSPSISADGRYVAFVTGSDNLVPGDSNQAYDVFVHDRSTGETTVSSANCLGDLGDYSSYFPSISGDGLLVAFASEAENLISGDTNERQDVFVHDRTAVEPDASWNNYGAGFPGTNGVPSLTASADPVLGTSITIDVGNSLGLFTVGFVLVGADDASIPTNDGGTILVDFLFIVPIAVWPAGASFAADVPPEPALCGESFYLQAIEFDDGAQYGLSFTAGLELLLGH